MKVLARGQAPRSFPKATWSSTASNNPLGIRVSRESVCVRSRSLRLIIPPLFSLSLPTLRLSPSLLESALPYASLPGISASPYSPFYGRFVTRSSHFLSPLSLARRGSVSTVADERKPPPLLSLFLPLPLLPSIPSPFIALIPPPCTPPHPLPQPPHLPILLPLPLLPPIPSPLPSFCYSLHLPTFPPPPTPPPLPTLTLPAFLNPSTLSLTPTPTPLTNPARPPSLPSLPLPPSPPPNPNTSPSPATRHFPLPTLLTLFFNLPHFPLQPLPSFPPHKPPPISTLPNTLTPPVSTSPFPQHSFPPYSPQPPPFSNLHPFPTSLPLPPFLPHNLAPFPNPPFQHLTLPPFLHTLPPRLPRQPGLTPFTRTDFFSH
ncbi:hypothetical protein C7M84_000363 [Penaeus vannamei]|uniref:Uncharacterized protein n=1 Tax=Penaeus vannamei TaxID=6689 RepID=A0A3R7QJM1_PENVA|nr:hypothetical protein C7M84_000363 [Penaeus vannamei]